MARGKPTVVTVYDGVLRTFWGELYDTEPKSVGGSSGCHIMESRATQLKGGP